MDAVCGISRRFELRDWFHGGMSKGSDKCTMRYS